MKKVTLGSGKITHYAHTDSDGRPIYTICGSGRNTIGTRNKSKIRTSYDQGEVTCKKCLEKKIEMEKKQAETPAPSTDNCARDLYKSLFGV